MFIKSIKNVFILGCILVSVMLPKFATFCKKGNYAVLRGSTLRMNCIPVGEQRNEQNDLEMMYLWTDEEGRELVESRFTKLENGDLEIVNAHVGDSGIYKCKIRSPASDRSAGETGKIYEHKLIVYELSGHKFVSSVSFDMSKYSTEVMITMLKDLLSITVCGRDLCNPGTIKSLKCEVSQKKHQMCEFSLTYEAMNQIADEKCDEECVREKMFESLKKAERILERELLMMSEDPKGRLKADMKTFDTRHLITCRAGFHLVKAHYKRCFPCLPGYYSEPNSVECSLCNIGSYQEHFGKRECDKCEEGKTTDTMGAKSRDECIVQESPGILSNIREGIVSIFSGRR